VWRIQRRNRGRPSYFYEGGSHQRSGSNLTEKSLALGRTSEGSFMKKAVFKCRML
jgi:hypothetical protein